MSQQEPELPDGMCRECGGMMARKRPGSGVMECEVCGYTEEK